MKQKLNRENLSFDDKNENFSENKKYQLKRAITTKYTIDKVKSKEALQNLRHTSKPTSKRIYGLFVGEQTFRSSEGLFKK